MKTFRSRVPARARVSTMIRKKSQALSQFELYKLVAEQQRIRQELDIMQQRVHELKTYLSLVDNQIETTEGNIQKMRQKDSTEPKVLQRQDTVKDLNNFQTIYLDY